MDAELFTFFFLCYDTVGGQGRKGRYAKRGAERFEKGKKCEDTGNIEG